MALGGCLGLLGREPLEPGDLPVVQPDAECPARRVSAERRGFQRCGPRELKCWGVPSAFSYTPLTPPPPRCWLLGQNFSASTRSEGASLEGNTQGKRGTSQNWPGRRSPWNDMTQRPGPVVSEAAQPPSSSRPQAH